MNNWISSNLTDFKDKKNLFVGVSWWPDSMYLTYKLLEVNNSITLLYFNHWTENSKNELNIIRNQFPNNTIIVWTTSKILTTETEFRNERFSFFDDKISQWVLFLWHHLDDRIETTIINNQRWCWIIWILWIKRTWKRVNYTICRPLLWISKQEILNQCDLLWINYNIDQTNFDITLTERNKIRQSLKEKHKNQNFHKKRTAFYEKNEALLAKKIEQLLFIEYNSYPTRKTKKYYSFTIETQLDIQILLYKLWINWPSRHFCKQLYVLFTWNSNSTIYYSWYNFFKSFWKNYVILWEIKFREKQSTSIEKSISFFELPQELQYKTYSFWDKSWSTKIKKKINQQKIPIFIRKHLVLQDIWNNSYQLPIGINKTWKYW